jgi:hypothetical protein
VVLPALLTFACALGSGLGSGACFAQGEPGADESADQSARNTEGSEDRGLLQSTVFLAPSVMRAPAGERLGVRMSIGTVERADGLKWPEAKRLFVRGGGRQWNITAMRGRAETAGSDEVLLPMPEHGAAMIGADLAASTATVTSEELSALFRARGGASFDIEEFRGRDDIRIAHRRSCVAIVRMLDGATEDVPSPVAMTKSGLVSEIRLDDDPTVLQPGDTLHARLYAGYGSRKGVAVFASRDGGEARPVVVDSYGRCAVPIDAPGHWRLAFHYAELASETGTDVELTDQLGPDAASDDPAAPFEPEVTLYTATVTFQIGEEP